VTTTITLTTHSWPTKVITTDAFSADGVSTVTTTEETVPPNATKSFVVTDTRKLSFEEMPLPKPET